MEDPHRPKHLMRIVQGAPLEIEVSPRLRYAGIERMIFILNKAYASLGHESFVAGPGNCDLDGSGTLIETYPRNLWPEADGGRRIIRSPDAYRKHFSRCLEILLSGGADVWHDHPGESIAASSEYLAKRGEVTTPIITTLHGDVPKDKSWEGERWKQLQQEGRPVYFVALSESQKRLYEEGTGLRVDAVVNNGIPLERYSPLENKMDYMIWLGRLSDIKGADLAVRIARKTGRPLIIAGELQDCFQDVYEREIAPHLDLNVNALPFGEQENVREDMMRRLESGEKVIEDGQIYFIGKVDDRQKNVFYRHASALLMPNRWNEPFGLVLVEAMATGTPAIVTDRGALPELMAHCKTGYVVETMNRADGSFDDAYCVSGFAEALEGLHKIRPMDCRAHAERRFDKRIMGENYIALYRKILSEQGFVQEGVAPRAA